MKKYYLALGLFVVILLSYQNCSDPNLIAFPVAQKVDCLDASKNLTIVDTRNVNSDVIIGGSAQIDFAVYERDSGGTLKAFIPQDPETQWPPMWSKNDVEALPEELLPMNGVDGVLFRTTLNQTSCEENLIQASIALCGGSLPLERNFFVGSCPRECDEHGVSARVGEFRDFYATSTAACGESCEKITRECLPTGRYGPGLDASQNPITPAPNPDNYTNPTCTQSACPTPTATPGGGGPSDPPVNCFPQETHTVARGQTETVPAPGGKFWIPNGLYAMPGGTSFSIKFRTGARGFGRINTNHDSPSTNYSGWVVSISKCSGSLTVNLPEGQCNDLSPSGGHSLFYSIAGVGSQSVSCHLLPNTEYYFNVSASDDVGGYCRALLPDGSMGATNDSTCSFISVSNENMTP